MTDSTENTIELKWPTLMDFIIGTFSDYIFRNKIVDYTETTIGHYKLVSTIGDNLVSGYYQIGIYECNETKYLIKTWKGKVKNSSYYSLVRECLIGKLLNFKLKEVSLVSNLSVPKIRDIIQTKNSLSIVFEYIEGCEHLANLNKETQLQTIDNILENLKIVSNALTLEEKKNITERGVVFHYLSTVAAGVVVAFKYPTKTLRVLKALKYSYGSISNMSDKSLSLAHRDLSYRNILVRGSEVYMIDCGGMCMTLPMFDLSRLAINKGLDLIREDLSQRVSGPEYGLVRIYIIMHSIVSDAHVDHLREYYFSILNDYE